MFKEFYRPFQRIIGYGSQAEQHRSIVGFVKKFLNDWSLEMASMLAYQFAIAILPIAVTAFGIFGLVLRDDLQARNSVIDSVVNSFPDNSTRTAVRQVCEIAADNLDRDSPGILVIGLIFTVYGGSRLIMSMSDILNIIYRSPSRSFLQANFVALTLFVAVIFIYVILFSSASIPSFLINKLDGLFGANFGVFATGILISITIGFVLLFIVYFFLPNRSMRLTRVWFGALISSILLEIFIILFPLYVRRFMGSFLGLIGFAVLLVTFLYYISLLFILGAQLNAYFFDKVSNLPDDLVTYISRTWQRIVARRSSNSR